MAASGRSLSGRRRRESFPFLKLSPEETARRIARACGHLGSNAAYLYNTVSKLAEYGIHDRNLWHLQELVAEEIGRLTNMTLEPTSRT